MVLALSSALCDFYDILRCCRVDESITNANLVAFMRRLKLEKRTKRAWYAKVLVLCIKRWKDSLSQCLIGEVTLCLLSYVDEDVNSHENLQSSYEACSLATFKQEENSWILLASSSFYFRDLLFSNFMPENSSFITPWRKEKKRYILISDIFPAAWKISHNLNSTKMGQGRFLKIFIHCYKLSECATYPTHLFQIFVSSNFHR